MFVLLLLIKLINFYVLLLEGKLYKITLLAIGGLGKTTELEHLAYIFSQNKK